MCVYSGVCVCVGGGGGNIQGQFGPGVLPQLPSTSCFSVF